MTENNILRWVQDNPDHSVVCCGIVEVRAAQRLADEGLVRLEETGGQSVDRWGAGSVKAILVEEEAA